MPETQNKRRSVDGILLLDKPSGITSNVALQKIKRLFRAKKAGHTGSLDPLASGMLPICFGEATKFSQFLLESDKSYRVRAKLGIRTATSDREGDVIAKRDVPTLSMDAINKAFDQFRGEIDQVPSMFSALKYQGQPLYKLARQGITVPRPSRRVNVYQLTVTSVDGDIVEFDMTCSKGTYVRTLVDDFGEALGCGAHVIALRRLLVGPYPMEAMVDMEKLEALSDTVESLDQHLLPISTSVERLPEIQVTASMALYLRQGQAIFIPKAPTSGLVRLSLKNGRFIGVGAIVDGKVAPKRLLKD